MSAISHSERFLRNEEKELIIGVVKDCSIESRILSNIDSAVVQHMKDGGRGSLKFIKKRIGVRKFGWQICEGTFVDSDGTPVSVTLNADQCGDLYELDIFKADSSPLITYPRREEVKIIVRRRQQ